MSDDIHLLPCPFCGATPNADDTITFQTDSGGKWGHVVCCIDGPDVRTGYEGLDHWRDEAIKAWNTRADGCALVPSAVVTAVRRVLETARNPASDDLKLRVAVGALAFAADHAPTDPSASPAQKLECALLSRREFLNRGNGDVTDVPDEQCVEAADAIRDLMSTVRGIHFLLGVNKPSGDAVNEAKKLAAEAVRKWGSK